MPRELILRLIAILKRVYSPPKKEQRPVFQLGNRTVNLEGGVVQTDNTEHSLTAKEHALLLKLYENKIAS